MLLAPLLMLTACGGPVFVPEKGPGAPGYSEKPLPEAPQVEIVAPPQGKPLPSGGNIDRIDQGDGSFTVTGWARVDPGAPRGSLEIVLPQGMDTTVEETVTLPRPDVVAALGLEKLVWSGFQVSLDGTLPEGAGICMISRSKQGVFRLANSDESLCPA